VAHLTVTTARTTSTLEVQIRRNVHSITLIALGTGLVSFVLSVLTAQAIACQIGLLHPRRGRRRPPPAVAAATAATPARAMARARRPMRRG
jgi:hypothetical protein